MENWCQESETASCSSLTVSSADFGLKLLRTPRLADARAFACAELSADSDADLLGATGGDELTDWARTVLALDVHSGSDALDDSILGRSASIDEVIERETTRHQMHCLEAAMKELRFEVVTQRAKLSEMSRRIGGHASLCSSSDGEGSPALWKLLEVTRSQLDTLSADLSTTRQGIADLSGHLEREVQLLTGMLEAERQERQERVSDIVDRFNVLRESIADHAPPGGPRRMAPTPRGLVLLSAHVTAARDISPSLKATCRSAYVTERVKAIEKDAGREATAGSRLSLKSVQSPARVLRWKEESVCRESSSPSQPLLQHPQPQLAMPRTAPRLLSSPGSSLSSPPPPPARLVISPSLSSPLPPRLLHLASLSHDF